MTDLPRFKDVAHTTVGATCNVGDGTVTVSSIAALTGHADRPTWVTLWDPVTYLSPASDPTKETVEVVSWDVDNNVVTIGSTLAYSHAAGTRVSVFVSADAMNAIAELVETNESGLGSHVADAGKHREIDDTVAGATDLWSASKISSELATKEPNIDKNTAFNKDFGAVAGTVCQGNDSRLSDARAPTVHTIGSHSDTTVTGAELDADHTKLTGIDVGANNYSHPSSHDIDIITESATGKVMTATERSKLAGIEVGATADQTKTDIDALNIDADTLDTKHYADIAAEIDSDISAHTSDVGAHHSNVNDPTADQKAALTAANSPSATNAVATMSDISSLEELERLSSVDTKDVSSKGGVFNGDFSVGSGTITDDGWIGDESYGWYGLEEIGDVEIAIENDTLRLSTLTLGGQARVTHVPYDINADPMPADGIKYLIPIKPNTGYMLSSHLKVNTAAETRIYYQIRDEDGAIVGSLESTNVSSEASSAWKLLEKSFTSPTGAAYIQLAANVAPQTAATDAYFDDIKLEEISTAAVGTEIPIPAGVQITGVTTTDNIDQSNDASGHTYALTTAVNEGATHIQQFSPDEAKLSQIMLNVAAVGTGDWTVTVHDSSNTVIASTTIANASMAAGDYDFDVPAILETSETYHIHVYSTVADGTVVSGTAGDFEDSDFESHFAKHTKSPVVSANGSELDLGGVELLTGATITVNPDGTGKYKYSYDSTGNDMRDNPSMYADLYSVVGDAIQFVKGDSGWTLVAVGAPYSSELVWEFSAGGLPISGSSEFYFVGSASTATRFWSLLYSFDNITWVYLENNVDTVGDGVKYSIPSDGELSVYVKFKHESGGAKYIWGISFESELDTTSAQLPLVVPSDEVQSEAVDLSTHPIDISESEYLALNCDLRGWTSPTITMLATEELWTAQAVSAETIYIYDSNGTTPWTWDDRNGIVPPSDKTDGMVQIKYLVGNNQICTAVNDGSMQAGFEMFWDVVGIRDMIRTVYGKLNRPFDSETLDGLDSTDFVRQSELNSTVSELVSAPASATAAGTAGQFAYDASYVYVCVATDTWVRAALSTWA